MWNSILCSWGIILMLELSESNTVSQFQYAQSQFNAANPLPQSNVSLRKCIQVEGNHDSCYQIGSTLYGATKNTMYYEFLKTSIYSTWRRMQISQDIITR